MLKRSITNELAQNFINYLNELDKEKNNKNYNEALNLIDTAFKDIFKLDGKFFSSFSTKNLIDMASTKGGISIDKCVMMAKLLEEEAIILEAQNKLDEAFYINQKSLDIFLYAYMDENSTCTLDKYFDDIQPIIDNVYEYKLPVSLETKIRDYYVISNKYSNADNVVYDILEQNDYNENLIKDSLDFYNKILLKENSILESGGITKSEIKESINELKSRL
ncbi:ribosomal protein L9 [Clostridium algifaecis]|uniref:Ribosomal protein L9 n=1 Tax=Clostridium algifaecis TaxID=1472040 RepID=A0ABS4KR50_9CLOT|nr:DUF6483 family protein [Clostridium algifaecis]MBP2032513.1 ribosomal protein L9 [Clostridium algifaecis]